MTDATYEPVLRRTLTLIAIETTSKEHALLLSAKEADQICNFANKPSYSDQNMSTILKLINDSMVKADDETRQRLLRLVP